MNAYKKQSSLNKQKEFNINRLSSRIRNVPGYIDKELERQLLNTRTIINRTTDTTWYTEFKRFGILDPYTANTHTSEYIFITKPDLHLFDINSTGNYCPNPELTQKSSFFAEALERYKEVAYTLQKSVTAGVNNASQPFNALLSNSINGHLELPSISANTVEGPANVYGTKISYRDSSYESDQDFEFSLDFKDTKYLEVYMWFKMYDMYERMKQRGQVTPREEYIFNKILHDQVSIYKFIVGEDGMTIRYYARITGCVPLSVPRETFGDLNDGEITFSTQWKGHFVRDMDPRILTDFNRLTYNSCLGCVTYSITNRETAQPNNIFFRSPSIFVKKSDVYSNSNIGSSDNVADHRSRMNKYLLLWMAPRGRS